MNLFRKKNPNRDLKPGVKYRDPLLAVALVADGVECKEETDSLLQLRRDATPKQGFGGWAARLLRQKYYAHIALDERGSYFWRQIDGQRTLREIAGSVTRQFSMTEAEGESVTILFVKELMTRGLIYLKMPMEAAQAEPVRQGGKRHVA